MRGVRDAGCEMRGARCGARRRPRGMRRLRRGAYSPLLASAEIFSICCETVEAHACDEQ